MLTRVFVVSTIAAAVFVPVEAQQQTREISQQMRFPSWLNEEVFWIISDAERAAFHRLQLDQRTVGTTRTVTVPPRTNILEKLKANVVLR